MATIEKRRQDNGQEAFRVKVRLKGYPTQSATFARLTDARKWATQVEAAIREGRHFKTSEAKKHTLIELIERYEKSVLHKKTSSGKFIQNQQHQLDWWKERLGRHLLSDITPALISEYRDKLLTSDTPTSQSTSNRYLAALSHVFTKASNEWGWLESNPVSKVSRLREPRGRVRFLNDDERKRLLAACKDSSNPFLYIAVVLALSTGARQMEILGLKWQDVNLAKRTMTLHETKNGERRNLYLSSLAYDLMAEHAKIRRLDTDLVFAGENPAKPARIWSAWDTAVKAAKIEDFRFHDLRHSAASYLAMNGASLAEIAEVLGHKTLQMVKRYAHLSDSHTAGVVERMNKKVFG